MSITYIEKKKNYLLLDVLAILLIYLLPSLSHLTSLQLYKFEPMRIVLLVNLLLIKDWRNAYIMAITLPLFSFVVGSHPVFVKAVLMAFELVANVYLFSKMSRWLNSGVAMFFSIVLSKLLYYVVKFFIISIGLMLTTMVSTSLAIQLIIAFVLSLCFSFSSKLFQQDKK